MTSVDNGALTGIRIIDFGQYLAGPLAVLLLAENCADVIRVDPPGRPRWDHPVNAVLQRNKRSAILDLHQAEDLLVARDLVATADVVIEVFRPGVMDRLGLSPDHLARSVGAPRRWRDKALPISGEPVVGAGVRPWPSHLGRTKRPRLHERKARRYGEGRQRCRWCIRHLCSRSKA
jgi:CoA-transferase family III